MQTALCSALKWLLVNEEICTAFADDGGLLAALRVTRTPQCVDGCSVPDLAMPCLFGPMMQLQ